MSYTKSYSDISSSILLFNSISVVTQDLKPLISALGFYLFYLFILVNPQIEADFSLHSLNLTQDECQLTASNVM